MASTSSGETIAELAKRIGKSPVTVWLWITTGVTINGRIVKLAAQRIGRMWSIDPDGYARFIRDCNPYERPLPESPAAQARRLKADRELALRIIG